MGEYNLEIPINLTQGYPMRILRDVPTEVVSYIYQYCPQDLSNAPPNIRSRCSEDYIYRNLLGDKPIPQGYSNKEAYEFYKNGGKVIPLFVDGETLYLPLYPKMNTFDLLSLVQEYVNKGRIYADILGLSQSILLGYINPVNLANTAPYNVSQAINRSSPNNKDYKINIFNDALRLYVS